MDLDFNETQQMLKQTAKDFMTKECPITLVREVLAGETGHSPDLWKKMVELGWVGLVFPEEYGGFGGTFLDLAALCEEFGRGLLPRTFYSTVTGGLAILNGGNEEQKRRLLPRICNGSILVTLALTEPVGSYDPSTLSTTAVQERDRWVINGTKLFIEDAKIADYLIVVARTSAGAGGDGVSAFIVPSKSPGISMESLITFGGDRQFEVVLKDVMVGQNDVLGEPDKVWSAVDETLQQRHALQLADVVGVGQKVLDMTVGYVKQRVQFGQPIGSFQAVQHHCANIATELDAARLLSYEAIWRVSGGLPAKKELSMAKAWAPDVITRNTIIAHRLHGGIGYVKEYDLHLYSNRAKSAQQTFGTPIDHLELVAQQMGM